MSDSAMPIPVSCTCISIQSPAGLLRRWTDNVIVPSWVNFAALLIKFSAACRNLVCIGRDHAEIVGASDHQLVAVLGHHRLNVGDDPANYLVEIELLDLQFDEVRLDLRKIEHVGDKRQQMLSGRVDALEIGLLASASCRPDSASSRRISLNPITAFSGVRNSWLIFARKIDLDRLALSAMSLAWRRRIAVSRCLSASRSSLGSHRDHVGVIYRHPRHVYRCRQDRDPADRRELFMRNELRKAPHEIGRARSREY